MQCENRLVVARATRKVLLAKVCVQLFFIFGPRDRITARAPKMLVKAVLSQLLLIQEHHRFGAPRASKMRSAIMSLQVILGREEVQEDAEAA